MPTLKPLNKNKLLNHCINNSITSLRRCSKRRAQGPAKEPKYKFGSKLDTHIEKLVGSMQVLGKTQASSSCSRSSSKKQDGTPHMQCVAGIPRRWCLNMFKEGFRLGMRGMRHTCRLSRRSQTLRPSAVMLDDANLNVW